MKPRASISARAWVAGCALMLAAWSLICGAAWVLWRIL